MQSFKANGKLLLTCEYAVLDGAKALCLPCKLGQSLEVLKNKTTATFWKAFLNDGSLWFSAEFETEKDKLKLISSTEEEKSLFLLKLLSVLKSLNPTLCFEGLSFTTKLDFPKDWGLGTSSTLVALLSQWANVNPYQVLEKTFGGSGYDIACANAHSPIFYTRNGVNPLVEKADFKPQFFQHLFFVYLNQKQNSREGIKMYQSLKKDNTLIAELSDISQKIIGAACLEDFNALIQKHEDLLSHYLGISTVQKRLFPNYKEGVIKSLGAWGGDFVMVTSQSLDVSYFQEKGYSTILKYEDLIF